MPATTSLSHPSRLEISRGAIRSNVMTLLSLVKPSELCVVVKANAYGHGSVEVAKIAVASGASMLGVARVSEARALREAGLSCPILLLSEPAPGEFSACADLDVEVTVYSPDTIAALNLLGSRSRRVRCHLDIDTGMGRVGCTPSEAPRLAAEISAASGLELAGISTHFASADEVNSAPSVAQLQSFEAALHQCRANGISWKHTHAANSAAAITFEEARFSMVRCGIAVYGVHPRDGASTEMASELGLVPAARFVSEVSFVKEVPAGQAISYGGTWTAPHATRIVTVPLGYADGVRRDLAMLGGEVLIGSGKFRIVGRVTMDQLMVDVGEADVTVGHEVVIFGRLGKQELSANELAARLHTIPYELFCAIGQRVERTYVP